MLGHCESGSIIRYEPAVGKQFGFIKPDAGGRSIFFHRNSFGGIEVDREPKVGDRVDFIRGRDSEKGPRVKEFDFDPFVSYHDLCHKKLGTTSQEGAKYIGGLNPTPDLSDGIRLQGTRAMYHSLRIHRDDVPVFVERVKKWESLKLAHRMPILIYTNETDAVFFSNRFGQQDVAGFASATFRLPLKVKPYGRFVDGIIGTPADLLESHFAFLKHIPNPDPACEPTYSGYYKKPE